MQLSRIRTLLPVLLFLISTSFSTRSQTWTNVGAPDFSDSLANYPSIAIDGGGIPYAAYVDQGHSQKVTVKKYIGGSWVDVGTPGFAGPALYTSIAIGAGGTPYVAFSDQSVGGKATVMKYSGGSWVTVGSSGFSAGAATGYKWLAVDGSGTPYVAFSDGASGNKTTVMKYTGTSWTAVGTPAFTAADVYSPSIVIGGGGTPYISFLDGANAYRTTVMKYSGSSWANVGAAGFSDSAAYYPAMAIDGGGTPYLAYADLNQEQKVTVKKFNGSSWVNVGSPGISTDTADNICLAIDGSGTLYVAYDNYDYTPGSTVAGVTVKKYTGSTWTGVGSGVLGSLASWVGLALNAGGTPYVFFSGGTAYEKANVVSFVSPAAVNTAVSADDQNLVYFPNPNNGSFTVKLASAAEEDVTIMVSDITGKKVKEVVSRTNTNTPLHIDAPRGVYIISATTRDKVMTKKMLVL